MKKDMFYNYDHHIDEKQYPVDLDKNENKSLSGFSGQWIVYDCKGNEIGLRVYKGAPINLHFDFCGSIDNDPSIEQFLNYNPIKLEILDAFHNVLISETYNNAVEDNALDIKLLDTESKLKKDTYYIKLYIILETGETYNLYDEKDGFLSII